MGVLGPRQQVKLNALADFTRAAQTLHSLTEQFAAARANEDQIAFQIKRRYGRFKRLLMTSGFDPIAQLAGSMETAAGRSASQRTKARILREGLASIRFQLEMEERVIRKESSTEAGGATEHPGNPEE